MGGKNISSKNIIESLPSLTKGEITEVKIRCDLFLEEFDKRDSIMLDRYEQLFYLLILETLSSYGDPIKYPPLSIFKRKGRNSYTGFRSLFTWSNKWVAGNTKFQSNRRLWDDRVLFYKFFCLITVRVILLSRIKEVTLCLNSIVCFGKFRFLRHLEEEFPGYIQSGIWKTAAKGLVKNGN